MRAIDIAAGGLGKGKLTEQLHAGATFDVYAGVIGDRRVCLKTPSPDADDTDTVFEASQSTLFSRLYSTVTCSGSRGLAHTEYTPPRFAPDDLLREENARIVATSGTWNHSVLWMGECNTPDRPEALSMVMPRHPGRRLSALDREDRRRLFPMMLPALWDALATAAHGDLHPGNLIVGPAHDHFAIIDPGVFFRTHSDHAGDSWTRVAFTTNPEHYPILPPYCKPAFDLEHGATMAEQLRSFIGATTGYQRELMAGEIPPHRVELFAGMRSTPSDAPDLADLVAAGVVYYQILAERHPYYDAGFTDAAWLRSLTQDAEIIEGFDAALARLDRPVVAPCELDGDITTAESELAVALATGSVRSRRHLTDLVGAALTR